MRLLSTFACIAVLLATLSACSTAQESTVYVHGPDDAIRRQIEANWNVDSGALVACNQPFDLRIALSPDGSGKVTSVEILPGLPDTAACESIAQSARRAVLISSPLKLPAGNKLSSIKLHFNPDFLEN